MSNWYVSVGFSGFTISIIWSFFDREGKLSNLNIPLNMCASVRVSNFILVFSNWYDAFLLRGRFQTYSQNVQQTF